MGDEFIPFLLSEELFEMVEEDEAFFVGDGGEGVVGVFALEVDDEFREFVVGAVVVDAVCEGFPADYGREVAMGFAMAG